MAITLSSSYTTPAGISPFKMRQKAHSGSRVHVRGSRRFSCDFMMNDVIGQETQSNLWKGETKPPLQT